MRLLLPIFFATVAAAAAPSGAHGDFDTALAEAKKTKKPLIVDFFGIWCPPCNELDELVFSHPEFRRRVKRFVFAKLDADAPASWKAKDRYKVGGYPTVLFLKPDGQEVERIVGFRPLRDFLQTMERARKRDALTLEQACRRSEPEHLLRCARLRTERKEGRAAEEAFAALSKKLKPGTFEFIEAASLAAELESIPEAKRQRLLGLMKEHPTFPAALGWAAAYLETFESGGSEKPDEAVLRSVADQVPAQLAHPRRAELGLTESDLYQLRALVVSSVQPEISKQLWAEAVAALERAAKEAGRAEPGRGFVLEQIGCLERAGREAEAMQLAQTYRTKFPDEFTFHFRVAGLEWRKKNAPSALEAAEAAYAKSYGDNRLRVATLLVELYAANGRVADANRVYEEATRDVKPDATLEVRTHRYLKALAEARARFASQSKP
jgi:thioredoxin-like negative regulator of GroEL